MIGEFINYFGKEITDSSKELNNVITGAFNLAVTPLGGQNALGVNADAPSIKPRALTF
tara:strand:- start:223 stop:396 length:174 start_codon:yes stop_codon:yes gene_type:complete